MGTSGTLSSATLIGATIALATIIGSLSFAMGEVVASTR